MPLTAFSGTLKKTSTQSSDDDEPLDIYKIVALAKRLNITFEDMKQMSFISLLNILLATVEDENGEREAKQSDIDALLG